MIDRLHTAPDGSRVVTYEHDDEEFNRMCTVFAREGLNAEEWRYVFSTVGGTDGVVHYFSRQGADQWVLVPEGGTH